MKIVFLGLNDIGKRIYDWLVDQGETILGILTTREQLKLVHELKPDLVLCIGFRHIVDQATLAVPSMGCINLHKALLPTNRGANPNVWSILESKTAGVSMHYMDMGVDTGPLIAQREVEISFADTAGSLYEKLEDEQFDLFVETWPRIRSGDVEPREQVGEATVHRKQDFKDLWKLDLNRECTLSEAIDLLRALTFPPFRNAYVEKDGKRYYVEIRITPEEGDREQTWRRLVPDYHE